MKISLLLFPVFLLPAVLFAQSNTFMVYSMKGNVTVLENKTEQKVKIGTSLGKETVIKLSPLSYVTLICNESRMFTLNKPANYRSGDLSDSCKQKSSSVSSNYIKYIWDELTRPKGNPEKNRKAYMTNIGAVSRSVNNIWIDPRLDTVNYVSGSIPLSWKSYADAGSFTFKLFASPEDEKEIYSLTTTKKHVPLNGLLKVIHPGKSYWWTAMAKGEGNDDLKYIRCWTKEAYHNYFTSISEIDAGIAESEAEKNFRLGFMLEEAHFPAEAYRHYLKATQQAPGNPLFRSAFMSFKKDYEIK